MKKIPIEQLKKNLAVKTAAFILLQMLVLLTLISSAIAVINIGFGWYPEEREQFEQRLYSQVASKAHGLIINSEVLGSILYDDYYDGRLKPEEETAEIIHGEKDSVAFGYQVKSLISEPSAEGERPVIKQLHADMKGKPNVYQDTFYDEEVEIEIYLADYGVGDYSDEKDALPPELEELASFYNRLYDYRNGAAVLGIIGLIGTIAVLIFLIAAAGHRQNEDGAASYLQKIPLDAAAALACIPLVLLMDLIPATISYDTGGIFGAALEVLGMSMILSIFILLCAVSLKNRGWWRNTVIYRVMAFGKYVVIRLGKALWWICRQSVKKLPLVWRTALVLAAALLLNLIIASNMWYWNAFGLCLWILEAIAVSAGVIYVALLLKRMKEGGRHLAEGDLSYQIEKRGMWLDFAEHADNLNSIGKGMSKAVEERMKSEHFKAELITNVSHDIKTPLTSIINYVDFLKKEEIENEKAVEYIEVLDRQSRRLKKLTEDLVDASKAATGNIKMQLAPCQIGVLMEQTMGEYKEKAEKNDLRFVMKVPEEELEILADGRRLWRVFDNLLGNICKYSQPGTRVYLDLMKEGDKAVIMYRNTSKYELNITAEELMERFVRGDSSRHTEGSGLGLSIARNLVELQGGTFELKIDGDLFKVIIEFDLM